MFHVLFTSTKHQKNFLKSIVQHCSYWSKYSGRKFERLDCIVNAATGDFMKKVPAVTYASGKDRWSPLNECTLQVCTFYVKSCVLHINLYLELCLYKPRNIKHPWLYCHASFQVISVYYRTVRPDSTSFQNMR